MLRLHVTATNISEGRISRGRECPIALAARDAGLTDVMVSTQYISWGPAESHHAAALPPEAVKWQRLFDFGKRMEPLTFEVSPQPVIHTSTRCPRTGKWVNVADAFSPGVAQLAFW